MLFDFYEDKLDELVLLNGEGVSVDVFESHYQKKFAIMYREKKGISLDDQDDEFKMQREMYLQLYTYLALVHLYPEVTHNFGEPLGMQFFTKENYHKMGNIKNNEPITFIHLKYADYFVARYIVKVVETGKSDVLCPEELCLNILSFGSPEKENQLDRPSGINLEFHRQAVRESM